MRVFASGRQSTIVFVAGHVRTRRGRTRRKRQQEITSGGTAKRIAWPIVPLEIVVSKRNRNFFFFCARGSPERFDEKLQARLRVPSTYSFNTFLTQFSSLRARRQNGRLHTARVVPSCLFIVTSYSYNMHPSTQKSCALSKTEVSGSPKIVVAAISVTPSNLFPARQNRSRDTTDESRPPSPDLTPTDRLDGIGGGRVHDQSNARKTVSDTKSQRRPTY